jgi:WD40 repeat protein
MDQLSDPSPFTVVAIPISRYQHHPELEEVRTQAEGIVDLLCEFGALPSDPPYSGGALDEAAVKNLLRGWATRTEPSSGVLLWLGHGASDGDEAWLASYETPDPINGNGIVPQTIADQVDSDWRRRAADSEAWALIVIEACGAARFVENMAALLLRKSPRRLALIGVGGDGAAYLGRFREALSAAVTSYTINDEYVGLRDLYNRLEDFLVDDYLVPFRIGNELKLPHRRLIDIPIAAPIDIYQELISYLGELPPDERSHFIPKAQGAEYGELAWYFVGRVAQRREIAAWLRNSPNGMLIVTGRAGTGKSALLGNVMIYTNPKLRNLLIQAGQIDREEASQLPPDNTFDAIIQLTGITTSELIAKLADVAAVTLPTAESAESGQDLEAVLASLRDRRFTILTDALDEAQESATIASTVLRRLAALPRVRVVVGTRASTKEGPDQPLTTDRDLLEALGSGNATSITVERDQDAIAEYIRRRLSFAVESGHAQAVSRIAFLASGPGREFLFARLTVHEVIANPALLSADSREELEVLLSRDHRTLFAAAVDRLSAGSRTARPLLEALALARGRGVPRADRIWAALAGAIAEGEAPRETDIDQLLTAAAPYVMVDAEDSQSVYRLAHQTFREYFLRAEGTSLTLRHAQVARALSASSERLSPLNPYIKRRLAEHVAEAGTWEELAGRPGVLDRLDPESVAAEALRTGYGRMNLPLAIAAALSARHLLSSVEASDRWMTRQFAMSCLASAGHTDVAGASETAFAKSPACWAFMNRHDPLHVLLIGHNGPIRAVTALDLTDGRVLLATGSDDGTIRVWDPSTGRPIGEPLGTGGEPVLTMTSFHSGDGRTLLAFGGDDGQLRMWDPSSGRLYSQPGAGHQGPIFGMINVFMSRWKEMLVTSGFDQTVLAWEMAPGTPVTRRLLISGQRAGALSVLPVPHGHPLLVTGGYDANVRLWDAVTGESSGEPLTGYSGVIHSLAVVAPGGGRQLVAAAGDDPEILVWDRPGSSRGRVLAGHVGAVGAITALPLPDGRTLLASGGEDATVRLWDPVTGDGVGDPLTGHRQSVRALTPIVLGDGRTLLASGGEDNTVRIWNPMAARRALGPSRYRRRRLRSMATATTPEGRRVLLTGNDEGVIQVRDFATGALVGPAMTGEAITIHSIAAIRPPDGPTIVVANGAGGSIIRWALDPVKPTRFGTPLYGHTGTVRTMTLFYLPEGQLRLASTANDTKIRLWDLLTGNSAGVLSGGHRSAISALQPIATPAGTLLASAGEDPVVILWDAGTQMPVAHLREEAMAVSFSALAAVPGPSGETWLAAGTRDGQVLVWNTERFSVVARLPAVGDGVLSLASMTLPCGRHLLAAAYVDGCIRLWDVVHPRLVRSIPLPLEQRAHTLIAASGALAVQTDLAVMVSELDATLASPSWPDDDNQLVL